MLIAWTSGGVGAIFLRKRLVLQKYFPYFTTLIGSLSGLIAGIVIFNNKSIFTFTLWSATSFLEFSYSIDVLTAFFLIIITLVAMVVSIYTPEYVMKYKNNNSLSYMGILLNVFLISLVGVVLAGNAFTFLIMWEVMSLLSFLLVIVEHEKPEVLQSGRLYLIMTHLGTGFIILAFLLMYFYTGAIEFSQIKELQHMIPGMQKSVIFVFALIGFGMKAGLVPIHIWLPRAHPVAPSHISTLMSAVMIKTAIYGFIRIVFEFIGVQSIWWGVTVLIVGMITAVYGILYGVVQKDIKQFLAYSSVENMGLIFMGLGASLIFVSLEMPVLASLALIAVLYHALNHALFKGLLFMGSGSVYYATGTKNLDQLGGLIRYLPQTAGLFLLGSLAIASFPPFNGFISKWLTFQSMIQLAFVNQGQMSLTLLGVIAATSLVFVGGLVALGFVKLFGITFLAQPRSSKVTQAVEVPLLMRLAMGILGVGIIVLGIFPGYFIYQISQVTQIFFPEAVLVEAQVFQLDIIATQDAAASPALVLVILLIVIGLVLLGVRLLFGKSRYEKIEPWACGVRVVPDMTYSGTSFTHPLLLIYNHLFGNTTQSYYQGNRIHLHIILRKVFDNYFYQPMIQAMVYLSRYVRRLQNGSIHTYLAYIFVSLIVLLLIASF